MGKRERSHGSDEVRVQVHRGVGSAGGGGVAANPGGGSLQLPNGSSSLVSAGGKSQYELVLDAAAKSFRLSERGKAEMVHNQLVQFAELLKIKLRSRLIQNKLAAQRLWAQLEAAGGAFFVPEGMFYLFSSFSSFSFPFAFGFISF